MRDCNEMSIEQIMVLLRLDDMRDDKVVGDYCLTNNKGNLKIELERVQSKYQKMKK